MTNIKPCPFCAAPASLFEKDFRPIGMRYGVSCDSCECWCDYRMRTPESAIAKWNVRLTEQSPKAALEASRKTLIAHGYCGRGPHGTGDAEINIIDDALSPDALSPQAKAGVPHD